LTEIVEATARFALVAARVARGRLAALVLVADALPLLIDLSNAVATVVAAASDDDERKHRENECNGTADAIAAPPCSELRTGRRSRGQSVVLIDVIHGAPPSGKRRMRLPTLAHTIFDVDHSRTLF
jgi:hypothetical protein